MSLKDQSAQNTPAPGHVGTKYVKQNQVSQGFWIIVTVKLRHIVSSRCSATPQDKKPKLRVVDCFGNDCILKLVLEVFLLILDFVPLMLFLLGVRLSPAGSRQLFSLLSVTSYSSLALHKLTLLVYNSKYRLRLHFFIL